MKKIIAVLTAILPSLTLAEEPSKWTTFTKMPDGMVWEYKNNSLDVIKGQEQPYWIVQWRTHYEGKTSYEFVKIAVSWQDCKRESGQIVMVNMTNDVKGKFDFVFDGGTLASNIGQVICITGNKVLQSAPQQTPNKDDPPPVST